LITSSPTRAVNSGWLAVGIVSFPPWTRRSVVKYRHSSAARSSNAPAADCNDAWSEAPRNKSRLENSLSNGVGSLLAKRFAVHFCRACVCQTRCC